MSQADQFEMHYNAMYIYRYIVLYPITRQTSSNISKHAINIQETKSLTDY